MSGACVAALVASIIVDLVIANVTIPRVTAGDSHQESLLAEAVKQIQEEDSKLTSCSLAILHDQDTLMDGLDQLPAMVEMPKVILSTRAGNTGKAGLVLQRSGQCFLVIVYCELGSYWRCIKQFVETLNSYMIFRAYKVIHVKGDQTSRAIGQPTENFKHRIGIDQFKRVNGRVSFRALTPCHFCDHGEYTVTERNVTSPEVLFSDGAKIDMNGRKTSVCMFNQGLNDILEQYLNYRAVETHDFTKGRHTFCMNHGIVPVNFTAFTQPYVNTKMLMVTRKFPSSKAWALFLNPFSWQASLVLIVTLAAVGIFLQAANKASSVAEVLILQLTPPLVAQGIEIGHLKRTSLAILLATYFHLCVLLANYYTSDLIGNLMHQPVKNLDTLQELIDLDYRWGSKYSEYYDEFVNITNNTVLHDIASRVEIYGGSYDRFIMECVGKILVSKYACLVQEGVWLQFRDPKNGLHHEDLHVVETDLPVIMGAALTRPFAIIHESLNRAVLLFLDSGLMHRSYYLLTNMERELQEIDWIRDGRMPLPDDGPKVFQLRQLKAPFQLLVGGLVAAFTCLLMEILVMSRRN